MKSSLLDYILHLADNSLILGHRNSEWSGHGPILEQDIAISNIALDLVGQSRNFYQYAAQLINEINPNSSSIGGGWEGAERRLAFQPPPLPSPGVPGEGEKTLPRTISKANSTAKTQTHSERGCTMNMIQSCIRPACRKTL